MKTKHFILSLSAGLLLCISNACTSQIKSHYHKIEFDMINDKIEYFDKTKINETDRYNSERNFTDMVLPNGDKVKYIFGMDKENSYIFYEPKNGWFEIVKKYYPNGVIQKKYVHNRYNSFQYYFKEYLFNESGVLVKTIDHDAGYNLHFEQVLDLALSLCRKYEMNDKFGMNDPMRNPAEEKGVLSDQMSIWREDTKQGKRWYITSYNSILPQPEGIDMMKTSKRLVVVIDDKTGKKIFERFFWDRYDKGQPFKEDIEKMMEEHQKTTIICKVQKHLLMEKVK